MSQFHNRVIHISYMDSPVKFKTDAELNAWYQTLGRVVAYGMNRDDVNDDTVDFVSVSINSKEPEIVSAYYPAVPAQAEEWETNGGRRYLNSTLSKLSEFCDWMRERIGRRPFVMSAVLHNDGKWGFHS